MKAAMQDEGKLILAYVMEGSDGAAWVLHRVGDSNHTAGMDERLDAGAEGSAKTWASELLKSWGHDVDGLAWPPHRPWSFRGGGLLGRALSRRGGEGRSVERAPAAQATRLGST
ncbi:hypothetical protein [Streptomyces sp. NPDC015350]|uniref:hypothetical protein n=1 Tax=Streptomyces sp. NPDC015350 TaxID=3364955 RepID=UPI0036F8239A